MTARMQSNPGDEAGTARMCGEVDSTVCTILRMIGMYVDVFSGSVETWDEC